MFTLTQTLAQVQVDTLSFPNGQMAKAVRVSDPAVLSFALDQLDLQQPRPVLVLVGGASKLSQKDFDRLQRLFVEVLAPLADEMNMVVVDGGTDSGVIRLMGTARAAINATFPLMGVASDGKVYLPDELPSLGRHPLEPHHSHFMLVPGSHSGDESPWIAKIASCIAGAAAASITVLANGGNVSLLDVQKSIEENRPIIVLAGTGRLADEIATAVMHPDHKSRDALSPVIESGFITLFSLLEPTSNLILMLKKYLKHVEDSPNQTSLKAVS